MISDVEVELEAEDLALLDELVATGQFGEDRAQALRHAFHSWWISRFMRGPKHFDSEAART